MGILSKLTISTSGDFGPSKGHEQIRKWVEKNGGKWVAKATKGITHLICSVENWKAQNDAVQTAVRAGAHVVSYDWLEDSLLSRRVLAVKKYTWKEISIDRKKKKAFVRMGKKADVIKFNKGCTQALEETRSGTFSSSHVPQTPSSRAEGGFFASSSEALGRRRAEREAKTVEERVLRANTKHMDQGSEAPPSHYGSSIEQDAFPLERQPTKCQPTSRPTLPTTIIPPNKTSNSSQVTLDPRSQLKPITSTSDATPNAERLTDNYHIYLDNTGFEYSIKLLRTNLFQNSFAQYELRLYESNTKPYVYCTFVRYTPPRGNVWPSMSQRGLPQQLQVHTQEHGNEEDSLVATSGGTGNIMHPNVAHAMSLVQFPPLHTPLNAATPYRTLIAPMNSDYVTAFSIFRAAFKGLTFLTWEERLDSPDHTLQTQRAQERGLEPFIWRKPKTGLPVGAMPALNLETSFTNSVYDEEAMLNLPATQVPLARDSGVIGFSLQRISEDVKRKSEREEQKLAEKEMRQTKKQKQVSKAKTSKNQPLFNGVRGKPKWDWTTVENERGGSFGVMGGQDGKRWAKSAYFDFER